MALKGKALLNFRKIQKKPKRLTRIRSIAKNFERSDRGESFLKGKSTAGASAKPLAQPSLKARPRIRTKLKQSVSGAKKIVPKPVPRKKAPPTTVSKRTVVKAATPRKVAPIKAPAAPKRPAKNRDETASKPVVALKPVVKAEKTKRRRKFVPFGDRDR